jgi:hypothetical protein
LRSKRFVESKDSGHVRARRAQKDPARARLVEVSQNRSPKTKNNECTMTPRRRCTASLIVLVAVMALCTAFQVSVPIKTRSVQKSLAMFFAEENGDKSSTKMTQEAEPAAVTEMKSSTEIEAPKFEAEATEKSSAPAVNSLDFS